MIDQTETVTSPQKPLKTVPRDPFKQRLRLRLLPLLRGHAGSVLQSASIVRGTAHGDHARRRPGPGEDFWDYRRHNPIESIDNVDWRRSARSDHMVVKRYEFKAARLIAIHIPKSPSLSHAFDGSGTPIAFDQTHSKIEQTLLLGMILAHHCLTMGDHVVLSHIASPPFRNLNQFDALCSQMVDAMLNPDGALAARTGHDLPQILRYRPDEVIVIDDFWMPPHRFDEALRKTRLPHIPHQLVRVVSPGEVTFPFEGPYRMRGYDSQSQQGLSKKMRLDIGLETRDYYRKAFASHHRDLMEIALKRACVMHLHHSDKPLLPLMAQITHMMDHSQGRRRGA